MKEAQLSQAEMGQRGTVKDASPTCGGRRTTAHNIDDTRAEESAEPVVPRGTAGTAGQSKDGRPVAPPGTPGGTVGGTVEPQGSEEVARLFAEPPGWLRHQVKKHREDPTPGTLAALCSAVAYEVLDNPRRGEELRGHVERKLSDWGEA